jgi:hypothetical protein
MGKQNHKRVRTPRAGEWVRVNPDFRHELTLESDEKGELGLLRIYAEQEKLQAELRAKKLTKRDFRAKLRARLQAKLTKPTHRVQSMVFLAANREGEAFLWPVKLPVPEDHLAYRAMHDWVHFPYLN